MDIAFIVNLLINSTIMASILFILILVVKRVFRNRFSAKWHYIIWFIFILRLAVPYIAYSPLSLSELYEVNMESAPAGGDELQASSETTVSQDRKGLDNAEIQIPVDTEVQSLVNADKISSKAVSQGFSLSDSLKRLITLINKITINYRLLFLVWIAGVILLSLYSFLYNIYFWSRVKNGKAFMEQSVIGLLETCKEKLGVKTNVSIIQTSGVNIPAIFGVTRPWLLMPEKVLSSLKYEKLRYVILHELAHLKRRDIVVNWLAFILQIIHWFNPLVWLAFHRMRLDRELACDEAVLTHLEPDEARKYGHTILDMAEIVSQRVSYAGIAGILENKSQLKDRIFMISRFADRNRTIPFSGIVIAIFLASSVLVNAGNYSGKADLKETAANSATTMDDSTVSLDVEAVTTGNDGSDLESDSAQTNEIDQTAQATQTFQTAEATGVETASTGNGGEIADEENKTRQQGPNTPESTLNSVSTLTDEAGKSPETGMEDGVKKLIGVKVTEGVTITNDFSDMHTVIIDKSKMPLKFPDMLRISIIRTDAASDLDILTMVSHHKEQKVSGDAFYGSTGEYTWQDHNCRYLVILFFDADMNYLGYYINEIRTSADEAAKTPDAGIRNGEIGSLGLKVTKGITIAKESSDYFVISIDKSKLPAELPDLINTFMTVTDDATDSNILALASHYKNPGYVNMGFEGRTIEKFHFEKCDNKYILILVYDTDYNYLGYYISENPFV